MGKTSRKLFISSMCAAGACICGFSGITPVQRPEEKKSGFNQAADDQRLVMMQEWIRILLDNIEKSTDAQTQKKLFRGCARAHYDNLNMDKMLEPFIGNLDHFNGFLSDEWKWKISHDKNTNVLMADENKSYCVCPIVNHNKSAMPGLICHCSEGFAELIYSKVTGKQAKAEVVSSVHRGDRSCIYKVSLTV